MTQSEERTIIAARKTLAAAFANRCDEALRPRALGVLRICDERPRAAAYVTIASGAWAIVYRPVAVGEVTS